ncbi:hypothetical protein ABZX51_009931 [Aspergillus tubingensis]
MESPSVVAGSRKFRALGKDLLSSFDDYLDLRKFLGVFTIFRKVQFIQKLACQLFIPFSEVVSLSTPTRDMGYVSYHYCPARKQYMYDTGTGFEMLQTTHWFSYDGTGLNEILKASYRTKTLEPNGI